jgi:hypothetical protein
VTGEAEVLGENLTQSRSVHHRSHMIDQGSNLGLNVVKPGANHLSLQEPHGITSQKIPFFIVTAVTTSNLT